MQIYSGILKMRPVKLIGLPSVFACHIVVELRLLALPIYCAEQGLYTVLVRLSVPLSQPGV